mmetsp:Transcript_7523/g.21403  ORF Transcript_7523/g.21403 Transcript_7523/m.21403 type:complete len:300 (+) Transcript_7523:44-943(+)
MCWSYEVALTFAVLQGAGFAVLGYRGQRTDLLFLLGFWPIVAQEFLQALLWQNMGEDAFTCSDFNKIISMINTFVVSLLPIMMSFWAFYSPLKHFDTDMAHRMRRARGKLVRNNFIFWLFCMGFIVYGTIAGWYPICTYVGPFGHQVWPLTNQPYFSMRAIFLGIYVMLCTQGMVYHSSVQSEMLFTKCGACIVGGGTTLLCFLVFDREFGSIWCWGAFLIIISAIADPHMTFVFDSKYKGRWFYISYPYFLQGHHLLDELAEMRRQMEVPDAAKDGDETPSVPIHQKNESGHTTTHMI